MLSLLKSRGSLLSVNVKHLSGSQGPIVFHIVFQLKLHSSFYFITSFFVQSHRETVLRKNREKMGMIWIANSLRGKA